jgi:hypothetical protein
MPLTNLGVVPMMRALVGAVKLEIEYCINKVKTPNAERMGAN